MQVDAQEFLTLCEDSKKLVFFDIESSGREGDYGAILCISFKPFGSKPYTFVVKQVGNDSGIVREAKRVLEGASCWCSYYGKGFDIPFINTRLMKWGVDPVEKKPHLDLYFQLKSHVLTGRRSQAHMLEWLETKRRKMTVSPNQWAEVAYKPENLKTMVARCESDVQGLESLYVRTRHIIRDVTR